MSKPTFREKLGKALMEGDLKQLFVYDGNSSPWYLGDTWRSTPNTGIDYRTEAGDARKNAIVMACLNWGITTFSEAPIRVQRFSGNSVEVVRDHKLTQLLQRPNPYYSGRALFSAMYVDYNIEGDAYFLIARNGADRPVELWYEPHFSIRSVGSSEAFIAKYQIFRNGYWVDLPVEDVVHFRYGLDPNNPRRGLGRLRSADRELFTDNAAAHYTAILLRNRGIPGVIISPKGEGVIPDANRVKSDYINKFSGDRLGEPMVMTKATDVYKLDFSPAEMDLGALRNIPEERISALLGIPAVVAGLGTGLDSSTYANNEQAEARAWRDNIIPTQMVIADTLNQILLPQMGNPANESLSFDLSQVRALQEDQDGLYTRMSTGYNSGFVKLNEARKATGWPDLGPEGDTFKTTAPPMFEPPTKRYFPGVSVKTLPEPATKAASRVKLEREFMKDLDKWLGKIYKQAIDEVRE